ncbi:extracellular solute-binding protein [Actinomadura sp. NEAU-AAG7]|uniref:extracellular solute-binding protein n=1 Tax=Actinomadura sp. NEAU-AAG7 TaxID=2839640 RepID=UPI001BE42B20|nr:extracellular solute-binding protein [Actinomadura sp. NEAU-AAG7]MBT2211238.1 extracellular solute-binding protein [Actinomadura sp. NEAU-AAG7]
MRRIPWPGGTLAGVVACAALALSACGAHDRVRAGAIAAGLEGRGPITFVTAIDHSGYLRKQLDTWNEDHPDERVHVVELNGGPAEQRRRLVEDAKAKSGVYAVLDLDVVWTAEFAANGWLARLPEDRLDLSGTLPAAVATGRYQGGLYAVPSSSDAGMLSYRKDLLDKAGIAAPPRTYAEMWDDCDRVRRLPEGRNVDCYLTGVDRSEDLTVSLTEAVGGAGGALLAPDGEPALDTPAARRGLEFLSRARADGRMPKDAAALDAADARRRFESGRLLFLRQWTADQDVPASEDDGATRVAGGHAVAPLPGPDGPGAAALGGRDLAVSAFAEHKLTALDFVRFLTGQAAQRAGLMATSRPPALTGLYDDPELVRRFPYLPALRTAITTARPRPAGPGYPTVSAAIQDAAYGAVTGRVPVGRALSDLQNDLRH